MERDYRKVRRSCKEVCLFTKERSVFANRKRGIRVGGVFEVVVVGMWRVLGLVFLEDFPTKPRGSQEEYCRGPGALGITTNVGAQHPRQQHDECVSHPLRDMLTTYLEARAGHSVTPVPRR